MPKCQERQVSAARLNIIFTKYLVLLSLNTKTLQKSIFSKLPPSPLQLTDCNQLTYQLTEIKRNNLKHFMNFKHKIFVHNFFT